MTRQSLNAVGDTARELSLIQTPRSLQLGPPDAGGRRGGTSCCGGSSTSSLFWVEAAVFLFFMVFWTVQTFELETKPASVERGSPPSKRDFAWGFGAAVALWLVVFIARWIYLERVIDNAHWIAAVFLFVCVLFVVWQNSRRAKSEQLRRCAVAYLTPPRRIHLPNRHLGDRLCRHLGRCLGDNCPIFRSDRVQ